MSLSTWFMAQAYDRFMRESEVACLGDWRRALLADVDGAVLEVGAGTGRNLEFYPDVAVSRLVLTEPDPHMRGKLRRALRASTFAGRAELRPDPAEALDFDAASFDVVVTTLLLCSVHEQGRALAQIARVLKPGGRFVFLEHVAADTDPERLSWQRRIEPVWKRLAGNCHLTRRTHEVIAGAGFDTSSMVRESMHKALPWVRPTVRGVAVKRG
jgi:ubiquinone/menaquinone biosynthesis C-methylase UbiE